MSRPGHSCRWLLAATLTLAACPAERRLPIPGIEVDYLRTPSAVIGGDPVVTLVLAQCDASPPARVLAGELVLLEVAALATFTITDERGEEPAATYGRNTAFAQLALPAATLEPALFGLPVEVALEVEVVCRGRTLRSPPFPLLYVPTAGSIAPPFNPLRFWADETPGALLACNNTTLVRFVDGETPAEQLDVGFPCSVAQLSERSGGRRYLDGESVGIAAIDLGPILAWSRPMLLVDSWTDPLRDPVVLRREGETTELLVLDRATGADKLGPLQPTHEPLGPLAVDPRGDILVLETELTSTPDSRTYWVQRLSPTGVDLGLTLVAFYDWRAPSYIAEFSQSGEHIYVAAATEDQAEAWIEKIDLVTGGTLWSTDPAAGWRYPLGESAGRLIVAAEEEFVWLDPDSGAELSQPFAPDSGKAFVRGVVEEDGSVVMLADPAGGLAQGLYVFAPDGTSVLRLHPSAAIFRWLAPAWGSGTLVSYYQELHWLYARADYAAQLAP